MTGSVAFTSVFRLFLCAVFLIGGASANTGPSPDDVPIGYKLDKYSGHNWGNTILRSCLVTTVSPASLQACVSEYLNEAIPNGECSQGQNGYNGFTVTQVTNTSMSYTVHRTVWNNTQNTCVASNVSAYWNGYSPDTICPPGYKPDTAAGLCRAPDIATRGEPKCPPNTCCPKSSPIAPSGTSPATSPATSPPLLARYGRNGPKSGSNTDSADPIDLRSGNVFYSEQDVALASGLSFTRYYNSNEAIYDNSATLKPTVPYMLGNWRGDFLSSDATGNIALTYITVAGQTDEDVMAVVTRPDGRNVVYRSTYNATTQRFTSLWTSTETELQLQTIQGATGAWTGLKLVDGDGRVETYDTNRRLTAIDDAAGNRLLTVVRSSNKVTKVTDRFGNYLEFEYAIRGGIYSLTVLKVNGVRWAKYNYSSNGFLIATVYENNPSTTSDDVMRSYDYNDPNFSIGLSQVRDDNGTEIASWSYDTAKRGVRNSLAGGRMNVDLDYLPGQPGGGVIVWRWVAFTETCGTAICYDFKYQPVWEELPPAIGADAVVETYPNGATSTYTLGKRGGVLRTTRKTREHNGITAEYLTTYDSAGNVTQTTDWNGSITTYSYDSQNREISRTEGAGTSSARTVATEWHASLQKPVKITTPTRETVYVYNTDGSLASQTETDLSAWSAGSRSTTYTYTALGQLQSVDGPLPGTADTTTYAYNAQGRLTSITNALGHITQITAHNALGYPQTVIDSNGITTQMTYSPRGWLLTSTRVDPVAGNLVTGFARDTEGRITRVTLPDASYTDYEYDGNGEVMVIKDATGARIEYERDAESNITRTYVRHANGVLVRRLDQTFDGLKQVKEVAGLSTTHGTYDYDHNGNPTRAANGLDLATENLYDALNRITRSTDALGAETHYAYDAEGNLATVTDARNLSTTYAYDGLGCLRTLTSPDTGITSYTCDKAGNVTSKTDARGVTATYGYDALSRLTSTVYSNAPNEMALFGYDDTANGNMGKGRLTATSNDGADTTRRYDARGNLVTETRTINGLTFTTGYSWDAADRLTGMTYPSGRTVTFARNSAGQITTVNTNATSTGAQTLASNIVWAPFGGPESLIYGNGLVETRAYDGSGFLTHLNVGSHIAREYIRDAAGRIVTVDADVLTIGDGIKHHIESFAYTDADRLKNASAVNVIPPENPEDEPTYADLYNPRQYSYDSVGNRVQAKRANNTTNYTYANDSNRLLESSGQHDLVITYDAAGNPLTYGDMQFTFNAANRMQTAVVPGGPTGSKTFSYKYNAQGERVLKQGPNNSTIFHYDMAGRLIAETTAAGVLEREYFWLDGKPLAMVSKPNVGNTFAHYYVQSDHIDTALMLTDASQNIAWSYTRDAYGGLIAGANTVKWVIRFPGQYYDGETGLHYNYFRDYDPQTGRYIESDPIGLAGGINTYAYVGGNPIGYTDPLGLVCVMCKARDTESKYRDSNGKPLGSDEGGRKWCTYDCDGTVIHAPGFSKDRCIGQKGGDIYQPSSTFDYFEMDTDSWWDQFWYPIFIDQIKKNPPVKMR